MYSSPSTLWCKGITVEDSEFGAKPLRMALFMSMRRVVIECELGAFLLYEWH